MNLEKHVTSCEISKKLFELQLPQESIWGLHWVLSEYGVSTNGETYSNKMMLTHDVIGKNSHTKYKAFLASELMELIPARLSLPDRYEPFNHFRFDLTRSCVVEDNDIYETFVVNFVSDTSCPDGKRLLLADTLFAHNIWDKTLPDVLAKTIFMLLETDIQVFLNDLGKNHA